MEEKTSYFNIQKYLSNLEIEQGVLEHLAEVQYEFNEYFKRVLAHGQEKALTYLTLELFNELLYSNQIEESKITPPAEFLNTNILNNNKILTNKRICNIQKEILKNTTMPYEIGKYRDVDVFVKRQGEIVYYAPSSSDVERFMQDFIRFYNKNTDDIINNDPFIKSALIHFLFVKIHPFVDGNGRVCRILHNMKFTSLLNSTYKNKNGKELELKLPPLNISYSIYNNKQSYYNKLQAIEFKKDADINYSVNRFIDFLLYMYEEQLYYNKNSHKFKNISQTINEVKRKRKIK